MSDLDSTETGELLRTKTAAALIGVSASTLRNWAKDGYGPPHYDYAGELRYQRDEVLAWKAAQRVETTQ